MTECVILLTSKQEGPGFDSWITLALKQLWRVHVLAGAEL